MSEINLNPICTIIGLGMAPAFVYSVKSSFKLAQSRYEK